MKRITRREFLEASLGGISLLVFGGCGGGSQTSVPPPADFVLSDSENLTAQNLHEHASRVLDLVQNPGTELRIGLGNGRGAEVLRLSVQRETDRIPYRHVKVVRESTGETILLLWGIKDFLPSVKVCDTEGRTLRDAQGREMEFGFRDIARSRQTWNARDLLVTGVKVLAIAFAVWLGAQFGRLLLSGVAFVAFSAMVLGALFIAGGVLEPVFNFIRERVSWEDVRRFLSQLVDEIIRLLREVADLLRTILDRA